MARKKKVEKEVVEAVSSSETERGGERATNTGALRVVHSVVDMGALHQSKLGARKENIRIENGLNVITLQGGAGSEVVFLERICFSSHVYGSDLKVNSIKIVHINRYGEAVILYEGVFDFVTSVIDFHLGNFAFCPEDKIIIEVPAVFSSRYDISFYVDFVYSTILNEDVHYLKTEAFKMLPGQSFVFDSMDYDAVLLYFVDERAGNYLTLNGEKLLTIPDRLQSNFYNKAFFVRSEYLKNGKNELFCPVSDEGGIYVECVKRVYNRDTFRGLQMVAVHQRDWTLLKMQNDFVNTAYRIAVGEMPSLDVLNERIKMLAQMTFNERSKGYYDKYGIPVATPVVENEGVSSDTSPGTEGASPGTEGASPGTEGATSDGEAVPSSGGEASAGSVVDNNAGVVVGVTDTEEESQVL